MAGTEPRVWTNAEKIQLLLEVVRDVQAVPNWKNIRLPHGRTAFQAQQMYGRLTAQPPPPPSEAGASSATAATASTPATSPSKKRTHEQAELAGPQFPPISFTPVQPTTSSPMLPGSASTGGVQMLTDPIDTSAPKKKRGRPSKADLAARAAGGTFDESTGQSTYVPYVPKGAAPAAGANANPVIVQPDGTVKRKRGRPTKAEMLAKRERLEQLGQIEREHGEAAQAGAATEPIGDTSAMPKSAEAAKELGESANANTSRTEALPTTVGDDVFTKEEDDGLDAGIDAGHVGGLPEPA